MCVFYVWNKKFIFWYIYHYAGGCGRVSDEKIFTPPIYRFSLHNFFWAYACGHLFYLILNRSFCVLSICFLSKTDQLIDVQPFCSFCSSFYCTALIPNTALILVSTLLKFVWQLCYTDDSHNGSQPNLIAPLSSHTLENAQPSLHAYKRGKSSCYDPTKFEVNLEEGGRAGVAIPFHYVCPESKKSILYRISSICLFIIIVFFL